MQISDKSPATKISPLRGYQHVAPTVLLIRNSWYLIHPFVYSTVLLFYCSTVHLFICSSVLFLLSAARRIKEKDRFPCLFLCMPSMPAKSRFSIPGFGMSSLLLHPMVYPCHLLAEQDKSWARV